MAKAVEVGGWERVGVFIVRYRLVETSGQKTPIGQILCDVTTWLPFWWPPNWVALAVLWWKGSAA